MKKTLVLCALSLIMCVSLITGATFALFTSESETNIAVNSGKVDIVAKTDADSVMTKELYEEYAAGSDNTFGTVTVTDNSVTLDKIVPGDGVKFDILVTNNSNVNVLYRTKLTVEDNGLFAALDVKIGGAKYEGFSIYSNWTPLEAEATYENTPVTVEIDFPNKEDGSNDLYQNTSCKITYAVEAVQANAAVTNPVEGAVNLYSADDLRLFAASVANGNTYRGKTVVLGNSIDLNNELFAGIGTKEIGFEGTFDGQGYAVRNLKMKNTETEFTGFVNKLASPGKIQNLTIENADIVGVTSVGTIAGGYTGTIDNCHVKGLVKVEGNYKVGGAVGYSYIKANNCSIDAAAGSYVKATYLKADVEGDNVGGFVGFLAEGLGAEAYQNISVKGLVVSGTRKVGGLAGYLSSDSAIVNGTVESCAVSIDVTNMDYVVDNIEKLYIGGLVGEHAADALAISGSVKDTTVHGVGANMTGAVTGGRRGTATITMTNTATATDVTVVYDLSDLGFHKGKIYKATIYTAQGLYITSEYGLANHTPEASPYCNTITIAEGVGVLDMAGYAWTPLNGFRTNFNGNGATIKNIDATASGARTNGFFTTIQGGTVENIILENVTVSGDQAGAIAGHVAEGGTVKNCIVKGKIVIKWNNTAAETWDGVGAAFGVVAGGGNVQATVATEDITVDNVTGSECEGYVTDTNAYVGYIINSGVVDIKKA